MKNFSTRQAKNWILAGIGKYGSVMLSLDRSEQEDEQFWLLELDGPGLQLSFSVTREQLKQLVNSLVLSENSIERTDTTVGTLFDIPVQLICNDESHERAYLEMIGGNSEWMTWFISQEVKHDLLMAAQDLLQDAFS